MITPEKEDLIRKLLSEGRTYREITKIVHCSPNEITRIQRKIMGENTEDSIDIQSKSICSQALDFIFFRISIWCLEGLRTKTSFSIISISGARSAKNSISFTSY